MIGGIWSDFREAVANLRAQKTRTFLTALGIVFGVGSVIGMLSIGAGAREQSLKFIEQLGVRKGYYPAAHGQREDAIVMRLPLDGAGKDEHALD